MARVILVPGRGYARPEHWQSRWAREHPWYTTVPRDDDPHFTIALRVPALHKAVMADPEPAVLVAHSGGCVTVVQWAATHTGPVAAALLVAPPYLDPSWTPDPGDPSPDSFPPGIPLGRLPFRTVVVASRTDPYATFAQAEAYAAAWGATIVDAGDAGHIDTRSGYGPWPAGERLLAEVLARVD
jgi:predicted alpha/beta hydrolase family esterase